MKSTTLFATVFGLLTGSALAGEVSFPTATGSVIASVNIIQPGLAAMGQNPTIRQGADFQVDLVFQNNSKSNVEILMPFYGLRYIDAGSPVTIDLAHSWSRKTIEAGRSLHCVLDATLPRAADVRSNFHVGIVTGMGVHLQAVWATATVAQGVVTSGDEDTVRRGHSRPRVERRDGGTASGLPRMDGPNPTIRRRR